MDQQKLDRDFLGTWQAAIVYPDGRRPVLITPAGGVSLGEAEAIGRTYEDVARVEGGRILLALVNQAEAA